jgi:hypothetical protein
VVNVVIETIGWMIDDSEVLYSISNIQAAIHLDDINPTSVWIVNDFELIIFIGSTQHV